MKLLPQRGLTLIESMIVVAIVGLLAALALPTYSDHARLRARVSEGLSLASVYKAGITETFQGSGPRAMTCDAVANCRELGITYTADTRNVTSIRSNAAGVITVTMNVWSGDGTVLLIPSDFAAVPAALDLSTAAAGTPFQWICSVGTIDRRYVPANCR